jgi:transcriptional regulator with XRE-family HTH domain
MNPEAIRAFRTRKGLSQQELGKLCGVGKSAISQWESGTTEPTGAARLLLEEYLSGRRCLVQLTEQEERLLNENVQRGNFTSREDYLTASLVHLIKHGTFCSPFLAAGPHPNLSTPIAPLEIAEPPADSNSSPNKHSNGN